MSEWDEYAAGWDGDPAARAYADAAFDSLMTLAREIDFRVDGAAACDFGCGTGLLTEHLAQRCVTIDAVDTSPAMLDVLGEKIDRLGWGHVRRFTHVPDRSGEYDLIVCSSVLAFVDDYAATVDLLCDRLAPGGLLVEWDWEENPVDAEPFGMTAEGIRRTLEHAGLELVTVRRAFEVRIEGETMKPLMGSGRRP